MFITETIKDAIISREDIQSGAKVTLLSVFNVLPIVWSGLCTARYMSRLLLRGLNIVWGKLVLSGAGQCELYSCARVGK